MTTYKNPAIAAVVRDQQLERLNFATGLRKDPAGYSQFQQKNIGAILSDVKNRKQSAFQKAQIDLGRYMDMHHNVNFYKTRSGDVNAITGVMLENNRRIQHSIEQDKENSKRQFEINEWYNYDKLETLFFLQIVFMSSLASAIVMYLTKKGMITLGFAGILYSLLGLSVAGVGLYKYYYTEGPRDVKLWHRRRFPKAGPTPPPSCPDPLSKTAMDIEAALAASAKTIGQCGTNINNDLTNIGIGAVNQLQEFEDSNVTLMDQIHAVCDRR
jgi:hypothetical protein